jgi:hypothetical protein
MCHCRTSPLLWAWAYIRLAGTSHACSFEAEIHAPMHARHNQPVVAAREISPTTLRGARAVAFVVVVFLIVETATRDQTGRAEPPSAASTSRRPHLPCTCATSRSFQNQHPVQDSGGPGHVICAIEGGVGCRWDWDRRLGGEGSERRRLALHCIVLHAKLARAFYIFTTPLSRSLIYFRRLQTNSICVDALKLTNVPVNF